jgi:uncharacterized membrane protein
MFENLIDMIEQAISFVGVVFDAFGVIIIVIGFLLATVFFLGRFRENTAYRAYRIRLGRTLLLSLEILVAADIIRTVAVELSLENLAALGLLVIIRTFLSWSLELEVDGRWPWQRKEESAQPDSSIMNDSTEQSANSL